jgi:hypothetical protein
MSTLPALASGSARASCPPMGRTFDSSSLVARIADESRPGSRGVQTAASPALGSMGGPERESTADGRTVGHEVMDRITEIFRRHMPAPPALAVVPTSSFRAGVPIALIQGVVARCVGVSRNELLASRRQKSLTHNRQIAMYLATKLATHASLPQIAREFRKQDHTTVMYARDRVKERMAADPTLEAFVASLHDAIVSIAADLDVLCNGDADSVDRFTVNCAIGAV